MEEKKRRNSERGAKTFRRRRAVSFLETLHTKRSTIKQQLEAPEFQSIYPILVGELKALDTVINEFTHIFEITESELMEKSVRENTAPANANVTHKVNTREKGCSAHDKRNE